MAQRLEQQDLLIAGYKRENAQLREQIEKQSATTPGPASKKQSALEVAEQTAALEASRAAHEKYIEDKKRVDAGLSSGVGHVETNMQDVRPTK